jgi:D-alanyl-lipoteichoic acid acyltransferase DltB (MBOAT superfamily)
MLFHTPQFLFLFLPITLIGYFLLGRFSWKAAFGWLALASLIFYGFWNPNYLFLISSSIIFNYVGSNLLKKLLDSGRDDSTRVAFTLLIIANLGLLAYFKYLMFFSAQLGQMFGAHWDVGQITLPIGISFYTFTQIAYLADVAKGKVQERSFLSYVLFVTYFPHLVAGPIMHHAEMMPQFANHHNLKFHVGKFSSGMTFFAFGLFKKIVLADGCAPIAKEVFNTISPGLSAADAWLGATSYTLQIYYDFSGYSDMAIGLSLLFNIRLPINFNSPYRARNIIDFWRRWHITLSRFLRDYLYIPLGGNRKGKWRRYVNLMITMLLGGLWHGANWTFIIWGGLHGIYLVINHFWRGFTEKNGLSKDTGVVLTVVYWLMTLLAVIVAWVFFRASSFADALTVLSAMVGLGAHAISGNSTTSNENLAFIAILQLWAMFSPNTNQILHYNFGAQHLMTMIRDRFLWRPNIPYAILVGLILFICALVGVTSRKNLEFLYFQF